MTDVIKALIVDDEKAARESLTHALLCIGAPVKLVGEAKNSKDALEIIIDKQPELVFLDIEMPVNDGFWLANKLRSMYIPITLIFVTAYNKYAIQAIRYAAFDFITKPIEFQLLEQSLQRFLKENSPNNFYLKAERLQKFLDQDKIKLTTQNGHVVFPHNIIIYCEAKGNYTTLYMIDGEVEVVRIQLGLLEEELSNPTFVRVSRSVLINTDYLQGINRKTETATLSDLQHKYEVKLSFNGRRKLSNLHL